MKYQEVIECLPKDRTIFHYFKDRYALFLLEKIIKNKKRIADIKNTPFAGLLRKPILNTSLKRGGDGWLTKDMLDVTWPGTTRPFILTVGTWGNKHYSMQTTRRGYNLVLQLNFSMMHDSRYRRLVKPDRDGCLNYRGHPMLARGQRPYFRETLTWARIDFNFKTNEALIEEIQSDWIRDAKWILKRIQWWRERNLTNKKFVDMNGKLEDIETYVIQVLNPYVDIWDEAMLAATVRFIQDELGINNVCYHSCKTGNLVKDIRCENRPPQSLYSKLPRRFCFSVTDAVPRFLMQDRKFKRVLKQVPEPQWYAMNLEI